MSSFPQIFLHFNNIDDWVMPANQWRGNCTLPHFKGYASMLRIGIEVDPTELRLTLEGELIEPWIAELQSVWETQCLPCAAPKRVVDLDDVTRVDESGKRILGVMKCGGAELFATGVAMKHLIKDLKKRRELQ